MKTIHLATGLLCAATLFASCNKDRYDVAASSSLGTAQAKTSLPANALVRFKSGVVMTKSIQITAANNTMVQTSQLQKLDLFSPISQQGFAQPANGGYDNLTVRLEGVQNSGAPALWLQGSYNTKGGAIVPVSFMVIPYIQLHAFFPLKQVTGSSTFLNLLNIDPDYMTANITADMWEMAYQNTKDLSNGEILVSEQHNPELYKLILQNLSTMLQVSTGANPGADPNPVDFTVTDVVSKSSM